MSADPILTCAPRALALACGPLTGRLQVAELPLFEGAVSEGRAGRGDGPWGRWELSWQPVGTDCLRLAWDDEATHDLWRSLRLEHALGDGSVTLTAKRLDDGLLRLAWRDGATQGLCLARVVTDAVPATTRRDPAGITLVYDAARSSAAVVAVAWKTAVQARPVAEGPLRRRLDRALG